MIVSVTRDNNNNNNNNQQTGCNTVFSRDRVCLRNMSIKPLHKQKKKKMMMMMINNMTRYNNDDDDDNNMKPGISNAAIFKKIRVYIRL